MAILSEPLKLIKELLEAIQYWARVSYHAMRLWRRPIYPGDPPTDWDLAWTLAQTLTCMEEDGWELIN